MRKFAIGITDRLGVGDFLRPMVHAGRRQRALLSSVVGRFRRRRQITEYFRNHTVRKLHLGASDKLLDGWLNSDLEPEPSSIFLDATEVFPFPDGSLDFVFCEHFIEHITREEGEYCMKEVFRCLRPGGVARLATPNLLKYVSLFNTDLDVAGGNFLSLFQGKFGLPRINACLALNHIAYNWGHQFLYTENELRFLLSAAGFPKSEVLPVGESRYPELLNLEQHAKFYGEEMNHYETMVVEGTKVDVLT